MQVQTHLFWISYRNIPISGRSDLRPNLLILVNNFCTCICIGFHQQPPVLTRIFSFLRFASENFFLDRLKYAIKYSNRIALESAWPLAVDFSVLK